MKKTISILIASLLALILITGCTAKQESPQLPNPIVEVEDASGFDKLGLTIDAPEGATDITYSIISDRIAQVQFSLNGASYTLRSAISEDENEDISGVYAEFEEEENAMSIDGADWFAIIVVKTIKDGGYLASWQYEGHLFTLYTPDQPDAEAFNELSIKLAESAFRSIFSGRQT